MRHAQHLKTRTAKGCRQEFAYLATIASGLWSWLRILLTAGLISDDSAITSALKSVHQWIVFLAVRSRRASFPSLAQRYTVGSPRSRLAVLSLPECGCQDSAATPRRR